MPIDTQHQDYQMCLDKVTRVRNVYKGEDAIKEAGETYLPRLYGQNDSEYDAYKMRGSTIPSVRPAVTAMTGAIMRKDPVIELPGSIEYLLNDIDCNGKEIDLFISQALTELNLTGRVGGLVEHDGERVKILMYRYEDIINWGEDFVVLCQPYEWVDPDDRFKTEMRMEYLELRLVDGVYNQTIWRHDSKNRMVPIETMIPTNRGEPLTYIPFLAANPIEVSWKVIEPPMLDMGNLSIHYYLLSVEHAHCLHFSARPTLFVYGDLTDENGMRPTITIGAARANHLPDPSARAEWLEFSGSSSSEFREAKSEVVQNIANLGAKMLSSGAGGVKAAETARIEASSETATLSTLTNSIESLMQQLLAMAADWEGAETDVELKLNRDFIDVKIDPAVISAYLQAYTMGTMSLRTLIDNLHRGEVLPKGVDVDDEIQQIIDEGGGNSVDLDDEPEDEEALEDER